MTFEYVSSTIGVPNFPDLVIPVSEILKAKNYKKDAKASEERKSFVDCLRIYSCFCGREITLVPHEAFDIFLEEIGNNGKVIITCCEPGEFPSYLVRVVSNNGEKRIDNVFLNY